MGELGDAIDSISRRVRDASNTAHTRAFVRDVYTRCASIVNTRQEYVLDSITRTTGTGGKALYVVETEVGTFSRVTEVEANGQALEEVDPWRNLWKLSPSWLTDTATTPLAWAAIGRDLVAIWPAPILDVALTFIGLRADFQSSVETEETGLREEDDDIVRELATALILLRQRDLDMLQPTISRMAGKMGIQAVEIEELMRLG